MKKEKALGSAEKTQVDSIKSRIAHYIPAMLVISLGMLSIFLVQHGILNTSTSSKIDAITKELKCTLAIPQAIHDEKEIHILKNENGVAILDSTKYRIAMQKFTGADNDPMELVEKFDDDETYTVPSQPDLEYIRVRQNHNVTADGTPNPTYVTYKYLDMVYTLKIKYTTSIPEAIALISGSTLEELEKVETDEPE